ncbi:hypothetical protein [Pyxidicoccus sp. MSG2]|uniref:hypothetical protein n=1 Tax=Pyxidicoccus sp. MSG2 TaxID=2996790 RepID=UPI0022713F76|nr:hypothetical protein [Pyxidicoccus sp. MSG2]MCY1018026.1 hypothetical protein [Pyxidicoccus sp. MSG2]
MTTKWLCATSTCPSPDLTELVTVAAGKTAASVLEVFDPEAEARAQAPAKPRILDVDVICPYCKTRQMFDLRRTEAEMKGRPILDTEAAALDKLRALFEPQKSAERLEAFGTWLFGGTAFFTTLVGFYAYTVHDQVKAGSQFFFTIALALLGLSMASAARMKTPALKTFNPDSPSSMLKALEERATERSGQLKYASACFAAALAFAGAAPALGALFSSAPVAQVATSYTRDASGKLSAVLKATAMKPGDVFGARIRKQGAPQAVLLEGSQTVKADGTGELTLEVAKLEAKDGPWELATYTRGQGTAVAEKDAGVHVLTGLVAPVPVARPEPSLGTAFSFTPNGRLTLEALGSALKPHTPVELQVRQGEKVLGWTRGVAAQDGAVFVKLELATVDVSKEPVVLTVLGDGDGKKELLFKQTLPEPTKVVVDGR